MKIRRTSSAAAVVLVLSTFVGPEVSQASTDMRLTGRLGILSGCESIKASQWITSDASLCNEFAVLKVLRPLLTSTKDGGRIYFRAACQPESEFAVPFPNIAVQIAPLGKTGLAVLREVLPNDAGISVSRRTQGIVSIRVGNVPDAILQTRIGHLRFSSSEQYDPQDAIGVILGARELIFAAKQHGYSSVLAINDHPMKPAAIGSPHLPSFMNNVTVDMALDRIAKTFGGIVLYGADDCQGKHQFFIDYADNPGTGALAPVNGGAPDRSP